MAYPTWEEPERLLIASLAPADDALLALARTLRIDVRSGDNRLVVVAKVDDEVSRVTQVDPPRPSSRPQALLLAELGAPTAPDLTVREADALIRTFIISERLVALRSLQPARGDRLVRIGDRLRGSVGEIVEVTSVDCLGQVWVKGAAGYPTRPQDLARR